MTSLVEVDIDPSEEQKMSTYKAADDLTISWKFDGSNPDKYAIEFDLDTDALGYASIGFGGSMRNVDMIIVVFDHPNMP